MEKYERLDQVIKYMFTARELADYLIHNHLEYALELEYRIEMENIILKEEERQDARED